MKAKLFFLFCLISLCASAGNYEVSSPNGKVKVTITTDEWPTSAFTLSYRHPAFPG